MVNNEWDPLTPRLRYRVGVMVIMESIITDINNVVVHNGYLQV